MVKSSTSVKFVRRIILDGKTSARSANPVACRYRMGARNWSQSVHPVPFDILDFCEGIGNYSNGMIIIASPGYYQVNAMLANVNLRIKKNSGLYSHGYGG